MMVKAKVRVMWGQEPRNAGSSRNWKGKEKDSPLEPPERSPASPLWNSDLQNCNSVNLYCFKPKKQNKTKQGSDLLYFKFNLENK